MRARRGSTAISHQIIDFALDGPAGSPARRNDSVTLFALIGTVFADVIARWEHVTGRGASASAVLDED